MSASGLGRPELAFTEPVVALAGRGRRGDEWSDLDGGWSMRFWDACDLIAEVGVKLATGVPGMLLSVLRPAARLEDRRVTVSLNPTDSPGAPGVFVYAPNNHGHIHIDLATQGPIALCEPAGIPNSGSAVSDTRDELHA